MQSVFSSQTCSTTSLCYPFIYTTLFLENCQNKSSPYSISCSLLASTNMFFYKVLVTFWLLANHSSMLPHLLFKNYRRHNWCYLLMGKGFEYHNRFKIDQKKKNSNSLCRQKVVRHGKRAEAAGLPNATKKCTKMQFCTRVGTTAQGGKGVESRLWYAYTTSSSTGPPPPAIDWMTFPREP